MIIIAIIRAVDGNHWNSSISNITDLVVNVGQNVLLECDVNVQDRFKEYRNSNNNETHTKWHGPRRRNGRYILNVSNSIQYIWCRFEEDWIPDDIDHKPFLQYKTCFEGDRHFVVNENRIGTVTYKCGTIDREFSDEITVLKQWKLYVDQLTTLLQKRETTSTYRTTVSMLTSLPASALHCQPPRCKPYPTIIRANCTVIELAIRYPSNQYGYNRTIDHWGTITCADQINGFQLWLIGYGVVKKFHPNEPIVMDNLIPGKRYCFNGWAYNGCGAGPVFTLEGVCAKNGDQCKSNSDHHCEEDADYFY
ncbi:hypothetical protein BLOT_000678 [Blomia tropicalis]|nr:hypothetical protein BLOT_000678 [Blomia tropicalis]